MLSAKRAVSRSWFGRVAGYGIAVAAPPLVTLGVVGLHSSSSSSAGYAYLYLGTVVLVALLWGLGPALVDAILSAALLDYFLVPPLGRLSIQSGQDVENLALFLLAAALVGSLAAARRRQEERAQRLSETLRASNHELQRRREEAEEGRRAAVELAQVSARVDSLAEADRVKTELLANVSHELRTPLAAIVGMSSALADRTAAADQVQTRQYAETIQSEGRHLARLVGDLLEMASLEAEAKQPTLDAVDALEALESAADRAARLDAQADIHVAGDHFLVLADDVDLQGVLRNLVENGARYSHTIDMDCRAGGTVGRFDVADRGPGVPAGEREAIFERFHRVPAPVDGGGGHTQQGSGLGLAICKRLVERMGGRIWCSERDGGGAVFTFELPLFVEDRP
jgi:K+-sensing histidine kinase KdpD